MLLPSPTQATILPGDGAAVLDEGEDVGQDLAGVEFVGQAVDDGHARVRGKALDLVLAEGADHHQVGHAADDAGAVLDRLGAAQLAVARGQVDHASRPAGTCPLQSSRGCACWPFQKSWPACGPPAVWCFS